MAWHTDTPSEYVARLLKQEIEHTRETLADYAPSVTALEHSLAQLVAQIDKLNRIPKSGWPFWKQVVFVSYAKAQRVSFAAFRLAVLGYPTESLGLQRTHYEMVVTNAFCACHPARADSGKALEPNAISPKNFVRQELKCDLSALYERMCTHVHGSRGDVAQDLVASWEKELPQGVQPGFGYRSERLGGAFAVMNALRWLDAALLPEFFPGIERDTAAHSLMIGDLRDHLGERGGWAPGVVPECDHFLRVVSTALQGGDWKAAAQLRDGS